VLSSGAQHPLAHCSFVAHRAAQLMPVTVEFTHTAFAQHFCDWHSCPGSEHEPAQ
jgi:hypothetical protein